MCFVHQRIIFQGEKRLFIVEFLINDDSTMMIIALMMITVCVSRRDMTRLKAPTQVAFHWGPLCHWQASSFLPLQRPTSSPPPPTSSLAPSSPSPPPQPPSSSLPTQQPRSSCLHNQASYFLLLPPLLSSLPPTSTSHTNHPITIIEHNFLIAENGNSIHHHHQPKLIHSVSHLKPQISHLLFPPWQ